MKKIYKINKKDFAVTMVTILVTLFLGIDFGVALGVFASIVLFIQKSAKPHYSILGRLQTSASLKDGKAPIYRNVKMFPSATKRNDMLMIRWDASIFFANTSSFKTRIRKHIGRFLAQNNYPNEWCLVLCFSGVNDVDFSGIEMMEAFFVELKEKEIGMTMVLCKLKTHVLDALTVGEIICDEIIPKDHILWEIHEAEEWWENKINGKSNPKINDKEDAELLSDDGITQIHGFTANHIVNSNNINSNIVVKH